MIPESVRKFRFKFIKVLACVFVALTHGHPLAAQLRPASRPTFSVGLLLGRYGFGGEVEVRPIRPLSLAARYEGIGLGVVQTRGIGIRVDIASDANGAFYIEPLVGGLMCYRVAFGGAGTGCPWEDRSWKPALALLGGVELAVGKSGSTSLSVEAGYWRVRKGQPTNRKMFGLDFSTGLRFRI